MSDLKPLAYSSSRCRRAVFDSDDKFRRFFKWLAMTIIMKIDSKK